ncbi:uncharacterized protein LOC133801085 isoform X2 [Humulus lupulus]|uniref:uncharacterized protein LOC133801085 isoform X2 n=1 Tax=Humulus lupulus TaxID=3486 RepID=UPI002B40BD2C|nr:uncharacterized protein LOC133801085 isoform X2 [Humulus lupulus]
MVSVKALLISIGVVLMSLAMKVSIPLMMEFLGSHVPFMWSSFATWLRPPYLYIIINGIIITIVASSRLHHHHDDQVEMTKPAHDPMTNFSDKPGNSSNGYYVETKIVSSEFGMSEQIRPTPLYQQSEEEEEEAAVTKSDEAYDDDEPVDKYETHDHHEAILSRSLLVETPSPPRRSDSPEIFYPPVEKPLVSARFAHRKPFKPIPEGGKSALKVSRPKRHETMENTWKAITEGRSMPLSRHMKKCESFENNGRHFNVGELERSQPLFKKSETFKDRTNQPAPAQHGTYSSSPVPSKIRKEPSLGQDELNKRVEAFIQKFNEEMRLQRQESLNQYMEMINRGSH